MDFYRHTVGLKKKKSTSRKGENFQKKERREGHMKDALALGGEEGRDKLR